jgi:hypothetical protein
MKNFSNRSCKEIITRNLYSISVFFFFNHDKLRDSLEKYDRGRNASDTDIMTHMRIACWITRATNIQPQYLRKYFLSMETVVKRKRLNVSFIRTLPALFLPRCSLTSNPRDCKPNVIQHRAQFNYGTCCQSSKYVHIIKHMASNNSAAL